MLLRTLLLRGRDVTGSSSSSADEIDAQVELALLQLWNADRPNALELELLALDGKCWRRLGLLLFTTDEALVRALVAVLERVAVRRDRADSRERVLQRVWRTQWRGHLREKIADCHARLARRGPGAEEDDEDDAGRKDRVATRLLQILGASLRVALTTTSWPDDDPPLPDGLSSASADPPSVMEVVELLLTLSTTVESTPEIARAAALELLSLLSLEPHALSGLVTTHICRSAAMQRYTARLLGEDKVPTIGLMSPMSAEPVVLNLNRPAIERRDGRHVCDAVYLDLLVSAAVMARPDASRRSGARSVVFDDTASMLQICTLGITSASPRVQLGALRLLCCLLALDDASASALSSAVRLSGILISISWLLGHSDVHIAAMAATTLEVTIRHSPPSDILRAIIEQGCVIIYRALLSASGTAKRTPRQTAVAASCRSLLNWVTEEVARKTGVVAASVQSILSSTNVLLQKNIVLTLQILAQRNEIVREALEEQEFLADALAMALQADDEAGLAVSLLSASVNCCDKCSTLKICPRTNTFHCSNQDEPQQEEEAIDTTDDEDQVIQLRCANGQVVETNAVLLREHSNILYDWKDRRPQDQRNSSVAVVIAKLDTFQSSTVQLFVDLLPKTQQEAATALAATEGLLTLQDLLRLANAVGSAKCWHASTSALCRMMSASNWLGIFQFASTDGRHPSLVLRCVRFALQLHSAVGPRSSTGSKMEALKDPADRDLSSELKAAALQLSQELFVG